MKVPKFAIENVDDAYAYYVLIANLPESLFWNMEYSDLLTIVADKSAYDTWLNATNEKLRERK